jgi:hypothetical protein
MSGQNNIVYFNGYRWRDVTNQTTAHATTYSRRQVEEIGGDPRRVHEVSASSED